MKKSLGFFVSGLSLVFFSIPAFAIATFDIDPDHSSVSFKIRHLNSKVRGEFTEFQGTLSYDPDRPGATRGTIKIKTASINTRNGKRDEHLRSKDFFWAEKFPEIVFEITGAEDVRGSSARLLGKLRMHGVTRGIALQTTFNGIVKDGFGLERAGASATTTINRKDFGINWNQVLDHGGVVIGDEAEVEIEIEAKAAGGRQ